MAITKLTGADVKDDFKTQVLSKLDEAIDTANGTVASAALFTSGTFATSNDILPAQITADQNDYAPTGGSGSSVWLISSDAARNVTGIAGGSAGRHLWLYNNGAFAITLKYANAASVVANRLYGNGGADLVLAVAKSVHLYWSAGAGVWLMMDKS